MSRVINRIFTNVLKHLQHTSLLQKWYVADSVCYPIVKDPYALYERIFHIKDATWETMEMPEVWKMGKRYTYSMYHKAQDMLLMKDVQVAHNSDAVITKNGVVWDKYESPMFTYMYARDANVTKYDKEHVYVRKPKEIIHISGACVSLLGVYDDIWAHFIVQFLPKLYYAESAGLLDGDITVIIPTYTDANIKELVDSVLNRHPNCKRYETPLSNGKKYSYHCDTLYWIPTASAISNDTILPILYQSIIPQKVLDILDKEAFSAYKAEKSNPQYEKIYLERKSSSRNMTNIAEIDEYFRQQGFTFIEPHKLSLAQKINIFRNAKIIVGPQSGAWTNMLFCNNAKGLMFTPISWLYDGYFGYITKNKCKVLMVPGEEVEYKTSHNPYYIPLDEIKEAYEYMVNEM